MNQIEIMKDRSERLLLTPAPTKYYFDPDDPRPSNLFDKKVSHIPHSRRKAWTGLLSDEHRTIGTYIDTSTVPFACDPQTLNRSYHARPFKRNREMLFNQQSSTDYPEFTRGLNDFKQIQVQSLRDSKRTPLIENTRPPASTWEVEFE